MREKGWDRKKERERERKREVDKEWKRMRLLQDKTDRKKRDIARKREGINIPLRSKEIREKEWTREKERDKE